MWLPVILLAGMFTDLKEKYIEECPVLLENKNYDVCYNLKYKSPEAGYVKLDSKVDDVNIKTHYYFKSDDRLPKRYRGYSSRFKNSEFNLGHTIVSDASQDFDIESLKETYIMSNVTVQYPRTNKYSYLVVEQYIRKLAAVYNYIEVLTIVSYSSHSLKDIRIPNNYYKILKYGDFQQCFRIPNDNVKYNLLDMIVDCQKLKEEL
jgi:endonuclease G